MGHQTGLQWLTGYLVEKALRVDNLFVFLLLSSDFKVLAQYQHRVLFWGVLGALLRGVFILAGAALLGDNFKTSSTSVPVDGSVHTQQRP